MNSPCILIGHGAADNPALVERLSSLGVPVLLTWMAADALPEDHPAYCGRPGVLGQRAANIILAKCTQLFCLGARLDEQTVNYDYAAFAPNAKKHIYDIDAAEFAKYPQDWKRYRADLNTDTVSVETGAPDPDWLPWCKDLYNRFRPELDGRDSLAFVDPFAFVRYLSDACDETDIIALGSSGAAATVMQQAFKFKQGQRLTFISTFGAMGADIPMAIGACIASGRRTVCVTGDGGFQLNAQELEVVRRLRLPIIFFVWNNDGYGSIRNMQNSRFGGRLVAADPSSGFTILSLYRLARAYKICYSSMRQAGPFDLGDKPRIVEVFIDPDFQQFPRCGARMVDGRFVNDPMHDMIPRLPVEDMQEIMRW